MAEETQKTRFGLFAEDILGFGRWRENQTLLENLWGQMSEDSETAEILKTTGQYAQIEWIAEQGMRSYSRPEQRGYITVLSQVADALGMWDRERVESGELSESIWSSIQSAMHFVGPEQKEELAQWADALGRAVERSDFQPTEGMEAMRKVMEGVREIVGVASDNLRADWLEPLNDLRLNVAVARERLVGASQGNMQAPATPSEVTQVLNIVSSLPGADEFSGLGLSFAGLGLSSDKIPNMTYGELLNILQRHETGAMELVNSELEARGGRQLALAEKSLIPITRTPGEVKLKAQKRVNDIVNEYRLALSDTPVMHHETDAISNWLVKHVPPTAVLDLKAFQAVDPETGRTYKPTPLARVELQSLQRRRGNRERLIRERLTND
jgi:hypothetical protein